MTYRLVICSTDATTTSISYIVIPNRVHSNRRSTIRSAGLVRVTESSDNLLKLKTVLRTWKNLRGRLFAPLARSQVVTIKFITSKISTMNILLLLLSIQLYSKCLQNTHRTHRMESYGPHIGGKEGRVPLWILITRTVQPDLLIISWKSIHGRSAHGWECPDKKIIIRVPITANDDGLNYCVFRC